MIQLINKCIYKEAFNAGQLEAFIIEVQIKKSAFSRDERIVNSQKLRVISLSVVQKSMSFTEK